MPKEGPASSEEVKTAAEREENSDIMLDRLQASLIELCDKEELFFRIIEFFPYPIQVYTPDGTSAMVNQAMLDEFEVSDKTLIIGKYNIFKDPGIAQTDLIKAVRQAFKGETVYLKDVDVPIKSIKEYYNTDSHNIDSMYQDATLFSIKDDSGKAIYVVVILITQRVYRGKESIIKAREYFKNNWQKDFSIDEAAKAANLSVYYFSRLFRKEVGVTPYNYYVDIKIDKIKEKLRDGNLTVTEAFRACGVDYNGHFAKLFKNSTGLTPSEYRKSARQG